MKWYAIRASVLLLRSLPVRGAWVEIIISDKTARRAKSLPVRGAWVEISYSYACCP